jgi:hypothetical protein
VRPRQGRGGLGDGVGGGSRPSPLLQLPACLPSRVCARGLVGGVRWSLFGGWASLRKGAAPVRGGHGGGIGGGM